MIRERSKNEQFMPFLNLGVSIILILKVIRSSFFLLISFIYSIISGYIIPLSPVKSWLGIPNSSLSEEILGFSHCFLSLLLLVLEFYIILYRAGPDSGRNLMEEPGQLKRVVIDALAGAISGAISRTVTSPLDVIKIRFQVQLEPTSWILLRKDMHKPSKYTGIMQASKDIFREEGLPGFWRGNVPALLMYMHYTAIQFTVLHKIKTVASGSSKTDDHLRLSPYLSYVSGSAAGCAATVGSYPLDLLRTILASQGEPKIYPNMRSAFVNIIQTRGIRGLYAGLSPTLVEIIPYAGLQFGTYDTFKRWMMTWNKFRLSNVSSPNNGDSLSSFQLFLCGFAAGTSAKAICHPLDVVKKRFQVEGLQRDLKYGARVEKSTYKNMYDALRQILLTEGWAGLYKGIYPSLIKSAPAAAVTFVAYEYISDYLESLIT